MTGLVHTFEALLAQYGIAALFLTITLETLGDSRVPSLDLGADAFA